MPVPILPPTLFSTPSPSAVLAFQFSSWYPLFKDLTPRSTIIRPLSSDFVDYLNAEGVFVPEGSEDVPAQSTLSDDEDNENNGDDESEESRWYAFPELDAKIRTAIAEYGAVFPKLNFSSPRDASWVLPASSPLKCTTPADVYLLLKSSDFVLHDLDHNRVFEGCDAPSSREEHENDSSYTLELVLRKWYPMDRGREMRCFVRHGTLIGISQRDDNHYDHLNEPATQAQIIDTIVSFWEEKIKHKWDATRDYTFDVLLTRSLSSLHILDFNPYLPRTDSLLFSYEELLDLLRARLSSEGNDEVPPELRVITSRSHPAVNRNAPAHQHNMVPIEALQISSGRDIESFAEIWKDEVARGAADSDSDAD